MEKHKSFREIEEANRFKTLLLAVIVILSSGMVFYHLVEKWKWLDSLYFCTVTLATIGYGDFAPSKDISKIFTIVYVFLGIATIFGFIDYLTKRAGKRYKERHQIKKED